MKRSSSTTSQTVTRPQTPPGQPYVPNPLRPEAYTGTRKGDTQPKVRTRSGR